MKKITFLFLIAYACTAQAQMYRWVDEKGGVHYTDTPPPPSAKKIEEKRFTENVVQGDKLPYSVQQAAKNFPVILYTGDCGDACKSGKEYLQKRGVPFTERLPGKNPSDLEQFKKVSQENFIPLLLVGKSVSLKGFNESEWASALDQAGYPKTNPLPPGQQAKPGKAETPPAKPPADGAAKPAK
jgi:hypothetical protein